VKLDKSNGSAIMHTKRVLRCASALALLVSAPTFAGEKAVEIVNDMAYAHAQRLVKIEQGRRLNLYCLGEGSPTVVFDAGLAGSTMSWALIQPAIAAKTRACSYDRAGIGFSDPARRAGSSANIVDDLHRLLAVAAVKPPYILVGHSSGGMNVRLYADVYPTEVVGMVLVDPSHEDQSTRFWKLVGPNAPDTQAKWDEFLKDGQACVKAAASGFVESAQVNKDAALYNKCVPAPVAIFSARINAAMLKIYLTPTFQQAMLSEQENVFYASADQVRKARRSYGDIPLVVLTASPRPRGPDETQEQRDARNNLWRTLHDEIAALSTRGVNRVVPDSRHFIQDSQPQVVNAAILEVLDAAKMRRGDVAGVR
jgi:pimeloyl-ACP methyl ester carboxylesterase